MYINGAITEPWVKIIKESIRKIVIIRGDNQYFLRTFRKSQMALARARNASMVQKIRVKSV